MSSIETWETKERTGLGKAGEYIERLISVPLNPDKESDGHFDLYYFIHKPPGVSGAIKTVLFCAGGRVRTGNILVASQQHDLGIESLLVIFDRLLAATIEIDVGINLHCLSPRCGRHRSPITGRAWVSA